MKKLGKRVPHRDVGPFLQWLRERMLGREMETNKRFPDELSDRTQPPPDLPDGPSHKLFGNYYYLRDARRRVSPPLYIAGPEEQKKLGPGVKKSETALATSLGVTPGTLYDPEIDPITRVQDPKKLAELKKAMKK